MDTSTRTRRTVLMGTTVTLVQRNSGAGSRFEIQIAGAHAPPALVDQLKAAAKTWCDGMVEGHGNHVTARHWTEGRSILIEAISGNGENVSHYAESLWDGIQQLGSHANAPSESTAAAGALAG